MNPWDHDPGLKASEWERRYGHCLARADLTNLDATLARFERYFSEGGECWTRIHDCREIVQETHRLWGLK